jgi:hypothetical protein
MFYNFIDEAGNSIECNWSYDEFIEHRVEEDDGSTSFFIDNIKYKRDYKREKDGFRTYPQNWPLESQSMGCSIEQIPEMIDFARSKGVEVDYNRRTGAAICTSPKHRRELMKLNGMIDRDSYI